MSILNSDFDDDEYSYEEEKNLDDEINRNKGLISECGIYGCIESIEEIVQVCLESERFQDGFYFINLLLEAFPYNSEYWLRKGSLENAIGNFEESI
jgi:hypothetical protein